MEKKIRITPQRQKVLEKAKETPLAMGHTDLGNEEYYFTDGTVPSQNVVKGMLDRGILKRSDKAGLFGIGQMLEVCI